MPKPVIYVPGYPGSHILERASRKKIFVNFMRALFQKQKLIQDLKGPDDLAAKDLARSGDPIRSGATLLFFEISRQASSLYRILRKLDIGPFKFGWDWRRPIWETALLDRLKVTIEDQSKDQPVTMVVHSTGGLILRRLLEREGDNVAFLRRIERIMAFGVPWAGTLKSLIYLAGQDGFAGSLIDEREAREILSHSWAAFDLLPPDPAKTVMQDELGNALNFVLDGNGDEISPLIELGWFHDDFRPQMELRAAQADERLGRRTPTIELAHSIPIVNVVGWGWPTAVQAKISGNPRQVEEIEAVTGDGALDGGDGTVPRRSAAWLRGPNVKTYHLPVGIVPGARKHPHNSLWRNPGGRNLLRHHLGGKALEPFLYGAVDEDDFEIDRPMVRLRLVALDGDGKPLQNAAVSTLDLSGSQVKDDAFDDAFEGRHLITIPRSKIEKVNQQLRRFTVEIRGDDGGSTVRRKQTFFIRH